MSPGRPPGVESGTPFHRSSSRGRVLAAYLISFLTIGAAWLAHAAIHPSTSTRRRRVAPDQPAGPPRGCVLAVSDPPGRRSDPRVRCRTRSRHVLRLALMLISLTGFLLEEYARRSTSSPRSPQGTKRPRISDGTLVPSLVAYTAAIVVGLFLPRLRARRLLRDRRRSRRTVSCRPSLGLRASGGRGIPMQRWRHPRPPSRPEGGQRVSPDLGHRTAGPTVLECERPSAYLPDGHEPHGY